MSNKKTTKKKKPTWYASSYRGTWNWKRNKADVLHKKPLRCPYCGKVMNFYTPSFYGSNSSDWYWECPVCLLSMPNKREFSEEELDNTRQKRRKTLEEQMKGAKMKFKRLKKIYECYGKHFTAKEKRDRLIETIEEFKSEPF